MQWRGAAVRLALQHVAPERLGGSRRRLRLHREGLCHSERRVVAQPRLRELRGPQLRQPTRVRSRASRAASPLAPRAALL